MEGIPLPVADCCYSYLLLCVAFSYLLMLFLTWPLQAS
jgi:hypothetical protein